MKAIFLRIIEAPRSSFFSAETSRNWEVDLRLPDARNFALQNRVLLLRHHSGVGIYIALGAMPFEESAVNRSKLVEVEPGSVVRICAAEYLVVMKAFANRFIDWHDVGGVIVRQGSAKMDWRYI